MILDAVKLRQNEQSYEVRRDENGNALNRTHRRKFCSQAS